MRKFLLSILTAVASLSVFACGDAQTDETLPDDGINEGDYVKPEEGKDDSSVIATVLDFEFDGELITNSSWGAAKQVVQDQLLYTIGQLNYEHSVGRLDRVELTNVQKTSVDGKYKYTYHAKMPVAWGSKTNLPKTYTFVLPRDVSYEGTDAFTKKYNPACVDPHAHDVDSGSMWYYYRPQLSKCSLAEADVVKLSATVAVSAVNTTGKYPEYHKVWEDNRLNVVAVFGKYEDEGTTSADAGIAAYNEFVAAMKTRLKAYSPTTIPETIPTAPGVSNIDIQWDATLPDGKQVQVNALLVNNVSNPADGGKFFARYEGLSTKADFIVYNGHAGLGQNVRALAQHGEWVSGQYLVLFMNGCDTYAYVDGSLAQVRAPLNPDDPTGTKYMDIVTNAMPAYFHSDSEATMAIFNGLMAYPTPMTYEQMFKNIDSAQVVLVTGDNDNVFVPGYPDNGGGGGGTAWSGMNESGSVAKAEEKRFSTPALDAGKYLFSMTGTGDADLYVRVGTEPTSKLYDCRPYKTGSKESCSIELNTAAPIHVMVRGYATSSTFELSGAKQ